MSRRLNPSLPRQPFGLLLVEGGDERALCEAIAGPTTWAGLFCWTASGRQDLKNLAALARLDPNFVHARSVGLVLDVEDDLRFHQSLVSGKGAIDVSHPVFEPLRHFLHSL